MADRPKVVMVGRGFGGLYTAKNFRGVAGGLLEVDVLAWVLKHSCYGSALMYCLALLIWLTPDVPVQERFYEAPDTAQAP